VHTTFSSQVTEQLEHWPKAMQHRNKQRLTKIYQYLVRSRRLKLKAQTKLVAVNSHQEKLEGRREEKALVAAKLESRIKTELLERLKRGTYGDIYNFPEVRAKRRKFAGVSDSWWSMCVWAKCVTL